MSSLRLPGKVLLPFAGAPMLERQIERVRRCTSIDRLLVATSTDKVDDPIAELACSLGVLYFRGSGNDVLDRFYRAAAPYRPVHVVRLTADCPLADWRVIDSVVYKTVEGGHDYGSNTIRPTWPDGLDAETIRFEALEQAWREATAPVDREHVTQFIVRRPDRFTCLSVEDDADHSNLRWTVDEPADYEFVRQVYDALYLAKPEFTTEDVLRLLDSRPKLMAINSNIKRNEGLRRSIEEQGGE